MTDPHIRKARASDADVCAGILSGWIDETDWMPRLHTRAQDHAFVSGLIDRGNLWVAGGDSGTPLGFIECCKGHVSCLYLNAESRGKGIGKALLNHSKSQHPGGIDLWCFAANTAARRFYHREGLVEIGCTDGENDEVLPDVHLYWAGEASS